MSSLSLMVIFRPTSIEKAVSISINPNPPICIIDIMTNWPKRLQWRYVSTTARPVTQVAEVDVKRQVRKDVTSPDFEDMGSMSRNVPVRMTMLNPIAMTLRGFL